MERTDGYILHVVFDPSINTCLPHAPPAGHWSSLALALVARANVFSGGCSTHLDLSRRHCGKYMGRSRCAAAVSRRGCTRPECDPPTRLKDGLQWPARFRGRGRCVRQSSCKRINRSPVAGSIAAERKGHLPRINFAPESRLVRERPSSQITSFFAISRCCLRCGRVLAAQAFRSGLSPPRAYASKSWTACSCSFTCIGS